MQAPDKIAVENPNSPGRTTNVDRAKYATMKSAMLAVMPGAAPGLTAAELKTALLPLLAPHLFPGGDKAGWWLKCVQLDLEAKGVIQRAATKPLRWHRAS